MSATELPRPGWLRSCCLSWRCLTALALAAIHAVADAQAPVITDADIERASRSQPTITEQDIEQARRQYGATVLPNPPPSAQTPNIDALPQPATSGALDLEALARGYADQSGAMAAAQGLSQGPGLIVFVSLAMPRPTLQRLVDQAARARASVVLRGMANGSLRDTVAQIQPLIGSRQVAVQIDPQAFDRFAITRVPSFVLVRDGARPEACVSGTCAAAGDFARVAGDVSLDYALEHLRGAAPAFQQDAGLFLARLRPTP